MRSTLFAAIAMCLVAAAAFGQEWSAVAPLHSDPAFPRPNDSNAVVAADGQGRWMTVWQGVDSAGRDLYNTTLTDADPEWGPVRRVNTNFANIPANDTPSIAAAANGRWIAVWTSPDDFGGTVGADNDIFWAVSDDNGVTWSAVRVLNHYAATDLATDHDIAPAVAAGPDGTIVVVWESPHSFAGVAGDDLDIIYAVSTDNGDSFGLGLPLASSAFTDQSIDSDRLPAIATDGAGTWVVCWQSFAHLGQFGSDFDILMVRSTNNAVTWAPTSALNPLSATDGGAADQEAAITTDGKGAWVAAWTSDYSAGGALGTDMDLLSSRSLDGGLTWENPVPVNSTAAVPGIGRDESARLSTDTQGNFMAVWLSGDAPAGQVFNTTVVYAVSSDAGASWSDIAPVVPGEVNQFAPDVAMNRDGVATAVWHDTGAFYARTIVGGSIEGVITDGAFPIACAAVQSESEDGLVRTAAADQSGVYRFTGLPEGLYTLTAYAPGFTPQQASVVVETDFITVEDIALAAAPDTVFHLSGLVTDDETGARLAAASVTLRFNGADIATALSCARGRYDFGFALPAKGTSAEVDVVFAHAGYESGVLSIEVFENIDAVLNATLLKSAAETGVLEGVVRLAGTGSPIIGAVVEADGHTRQTALTGVDGGYAFTGLATGVYTVRASGVGFLGSSPETVAVTLDGEAEMDFGLAPANTAGVVSADLQPAAAANDGAAWRFEGEVDWRPASDTPRPAGSAIVEFRHAEGWLTPARQSVEVTAGSTTDVTGLYRRDADVNGDGAVDASDIQTVINAALGVTVNPNADINGDGSVNAIDIQTVINAVLGID